MITVGEAKQALGALPAFVAAVERVVEGAGTLADAETIAEDALATAVLVDPALAPIATIVSVAAEVAALIAANSIPDPNPIVDGQTTPPSGGWVGR